MALPLAKGGFCLMIKNMSEKRDFKGALFLLKMHKQNDMIRATINGGNSSIIYSRGRSCYNVGVIELFPPALLQDRRAL